MDIDFGRALPYVLHCFFFIYTFDRQTQTDRNEAHNRDIWLRKRNLQRPPLARNGLEHAITFCG